MKAPVEIHPRAKIKKHTKTKPWKGLLEYLEWRKKNKIWLQLRRLKVSILYGLLHDIF